MRIFQPDRYLLAAFVERNAKRITGHLLDVGGGDGKRYRGFFPHVKRYTTLDPDESLHPDIVASAEKIPLPDSSVDGILCMEVLMDVWNLKEAAAEMARVLKPGGILLLSASFMGALYNEPWNYWRFTPFALDDLLRPHFRSVAVGRRGGYRSVRAQLWIRWRIEQSLLYRKRILGAFYSFLSMLRGRSAIRRDRKDKSAANFKFTLGYNVVATK